MGTQPFCKIGCWIIEFVIIKEIFFFIFLILFVDSQVARRLSLIKHPRCSTLSGGQAIELLAKDGERSKFLFKPPMGQHYDCNFSFAGLRNQVTLAIKKKETEEGKKTWRFNQIKMGKMGISSILHLKSILSQPLV